MTCRYVIYKDDERNIEYRLRSITNMKLFKDFLRSCNIRDKCEYKEVYISDNEIDMIRRAISVEMREMSDYKYLLEYLLLDDEDGEDILQTVFKDGELLIDDNFAQIRESKDSKQLITLTTDELNEIIAQAVATSVKKCYLKNKLI